MPQTSPPLMAVLSNHTEGLERARELDGRGMFTFGLFETIRWKQSSLLCDAESVPAADMSSVTCEDGEKESGG